MRIAFLNSWTLDIAKGSGTAAAITGLAGGLEANGHMVEIIGPNQRAASLLLQRLLYNLELEDRISPDDFDFIVGFDIDGFDLNINVPFIVYLHGISADEMRFERGAPRQYLRALSHLERANAGRADRVIVTSEYSRGVACEAYGLSAEKVGVVGNGIHSADWKHVRENEAPIGANHFIGGAAISQKEHQKPHPGLAEGTRGRARCEVAHRGGRTVFEEP